MSKSTKKTRRKHSLRLLRAEFLGIEGLEHMSQRLITSKTHRIIGFRTFASFLKATGRAFEWEDFKAEKKSKSQRDRAALNRAVLNDKDARRALDSEAIDAEFEEVLEETG